MACLWLVGRSVTGFRELAQKVDAHLVGGRPLGTAIQYGVAQALRHAAALAAGVTMAEILQRECQTGLDILPPPTCSRC